MVWHFSVISLQYIIGGCISIIVTAYTFHKNPKTLEIISFFLYGLFTSVWAFFTFLHRTAPTAALSGLFLKVAFCFIPAYLAFLLITIFCVRKSKKSYLLCLIPAIIVGIFEFVLPTDIFSGRWGWSYRFSPTLAAIYFPSIIGYSIAISSVLLLFVKKYRLVVQKKYKIILYSFILYWVITVVSNYIISANPSFPPSAGIFTTIFFLFVAYAINLPTEKIIRPRLKKPLGGLEGSYLQFLNAFQDKVPSKELGSSSFRFQDYIEAMGLRDVVVPESGKLTFNPDKLSDEDISEIPDNILRVIKGHSWLIEAVNDFTDVFVRTYETLRLKSKDGANEWLEQIFQRHGGFLAKQGGLAAMPKEVKIPEIFKELQPGRAYLFKEEKPAQAYKKLKEALNYGFVCLCISKLHPQKVRERYDVGKASIFWLTFKKAEGTINPKDFAKLNRTISEFVKRPSASIVLIDCLDQIKFANGFQKSLTVLKDFRNLCNETSSIILISINPKMFEKQQLAAIEKELEEVKIE